MVSNKEILENNTKFIRCYCGREWPFASEQAASVNLFGGCMVCQKDEMIKDELNLIVETTDKRGVYKNKVEEFKQYKRKGFSEMRPYVKDEDLSLISVAEVDNPETDMGMVARNPENHKDQWYVAREYFENNLEPV